MNEVDNIWNDFDTSIILWKSETIEIWSQLNNIKQFNNLQNDVIRRKRQIYTNYDRNIQQSTPPKYIDVNIPYYNSYAGYEQYNIHYPVNDRDSYLPPNVNEEPKEIPIEKPECGKFLF